MRTFATASEAYLGTIRYILGNPEHIISPRGQKTYEVLDYQYRVLHPKVGPIVTYDEERNKVIADYTEKELEWYKSGRCEVVLAPSKFWEKLAHPDGTITSNYGYLVMLDASEGNHFELTVSPPKPEDAWACVHLRTPYQWALESLKRDKDSRQALMRVNKPEHMWVGSKDVTCTISVMTMIRDEKLHFSVVQRSGDMGFGVVYDLPWWIWLQHHMVEDLKGTYPELQVGHITHTIHSCHIYERDLEKMKKMLGEIS